MSYINNVPKYGRFNKSREVDESDTLSRELMIRELNKYFSDEEEPQVGIFWYDTKTDNLFEVHSIAISKLNGEISLPRLHRKVWQQRSHRAEDLKYRGLPYEPIYFYDYTQIPRGRVYYVNNTFYIVTGKWINDNADYITQLIIEEFNLQDQKIKLKYDSHWDIGHGWSSERDELEFEFD